MGRRCFVLLAFVSCCSISYAEEIPLDEIWALDLPGSKNVRDLEDREQLSKFHTPELLRKSLVENTVWLLNVSHRPKSSRSVNPGFVVAATGLEALKLANATLKKEISRVESHDPNTELTLVFYVYAWSRNIRINEILMRDNKIVLKYHFFDHGHPTASPFFALVPLGKKLAPGRYDVCFDQLQDTARRGLEAKQLDPAIVNRIVCDSFAFEVVDSK